MEIESVKCECCGLKEDCTQDYIREVKTNFDGKWLCGLCSEAVRDEIISRSYKFHGGAGGGGGLEEAVNAHMAFCGKYFKTNPAGQVANGMRQMLRRRSSDVAAGSSSSSKSSNNNKYARSASTKLY
ncbi:hypothetical protein ACFE04_007541 [Oxalis oulophora]